MKKKRCSTFFFPWLSHCHLGSQVDGHQISANWTEAEFAVDRVGHLKDVPQNWEIWVAKNHLKEVTYISLLGI